MTAPRRDVYLPSVALARRLAKQRGLDGVVIDRLCGRQVLPRLYGGTLRQCHELGKLVDFIVNAVEQEKVKLSSLDTGGSPTAVRTRPQRIHMSTAMHNNRYAHDWTDARIAELKELWFEGFSASECGKRLGVIT